MAPLSRFLIVTGGFVAAGLAASVAVQLYIGSTPGVDRSGGMSAFGDSAYFLAALAAFSVPATCLALYFLRPSPRFWKALSLVAAIACFLSVGAFSFYLIQFGSEGRSLLVSLTPLWLLAAPIFGGAFALSGLFAPSHGRRKMLLVASGMHLLLFAYVVLQWFGSGEKQHSHLGTIPGAEPGITLVSES